MTEKIRKFISRAPRYVLRPEDKANLRFSLQRNADEDGGGVAETIMLNLSETGVAFLLPSQAHPYVGEKIKVEIPIPNGEQIAWFGTVMHVREYHPSRWTLQKDRFKDEPRVVVGLRFEKLPQAHSRALRRGIEQSFIKAMRDQQYHNWIYYRALFFQYVPRFVFYFLLTALAVGFIYYFQMPDAKYDAKRGAPWGERFKF